MRFVRRVLRYLGYSLVALLVVAAGAAAALTLTDGGRQYLAGLASDMASGPGRTVRISGIAGIWSGNLTIDEVVVEDVRGPWLAARAVEVEWSPLALLGATFTADRVQAGRIELERLPEAAEAGDGGGFSLPVEVDIRAIDLPEIALGDEIAGSVARLAASGALRIEGSPVAIETTLDLRRTDGREGTLAVVFAYLPDENRIDLQIEGAEPAGGVIANLLRLPGEPSVEITAEGSGPAANWAGRATFAVDGEVVTRLSGVHQLTDAGSRIEATGDGEFAAFLPASLAPVAAGNTTFEIAGTLGEGSSVTIESARLESDAVRASASGNIDADALSDFSLNAEARGEPVRLAFGEAGQQVEARVARAELRMFGPGDALAIDGTAELSFAGTADHTVEDVTLVVKSEDFDIASRSGRVIVSAKADAAGSTNDMLAKLLAGGFDAEAAVDIGADATAFETMRLRTGTANGAVSGTYARDTGALAADFSAELLSTVLPAAAQAPLDRIVTLSGRVERSAEGVVSASGLEAASGSLTAGGTATLGADTISADITGRIADLSRLSANATGAADFTLSASGAPSRPDFALTLSSPGMEVGGRAIEGLRLEASGVADPADPSGRLRLSGTVGGEALSGAATLPAGADSREIRDLELSLGENRLTGSLRLDASLLPEGTVEFSLPDVAPLGALALLDVDGSARGSARFEVDEGIPSVTLDALVDTFAMDELSAGEVRINATARDYLSQPTVAGAISAGRVIRGETELRDLSVTLKREDGWTGFDGRLSASGIPVEAAGRVRMANERSDIELHSASATLRGITAELARPTRVVVQDQTARLDGVVIAAAGGTAEISGTVGAPLDISVRLDALPAAALGEFAPGLDPAGTLSGTARVTGQASNPSISYDARWRGGQLAQTRAAGFGAIDVTSTGSYAGGVLRFQGRVGDGSGLGMDGGGSVNVAQRSIDANFSGRVPFSFLTRRLAAQGAGLEGGADVAFSLSGNLFSPQLSGTVRTSGARFLHAPTGVAINDLAADVSVGGGTATINRLSGALSTGGTIAGSGTVTIDPAGNFPADLSLTLDNGRYTDGRVVTASLDGQLTLTGPLVAKPLLSGQVNLGRTVITIPERLPASLSTLDVQHRNAPAAVRQQDAALNPSGGATGGGGLNLDLQVNAPQQIFVQGRGLDAELGGSLRLTGPASAAQAVGEFQMRRGRLEILGRRLEFTRGTLGFSGSLIPYLNLAAESRVQDATVTVLVTGPANNPAFAFESSPGLPEDEILARLIFGRSMSNLSPVQIAQLASAAAQLAGIGGSTSLLQSLREGTGLDDIDIRTNEETGDTSLAIGRYLNDRTYLSIERGSQPGSGKATIDLEIGRGLKLRGEASDDGKTRGGIFYEQEY